MMISFTRRLVCLLLLAISNAFAQSVVEGIFGAQGLPTSTTLDPALVTHIPASTAACDETAAWIYHAGATTATTNTDGIARAVLEMTRKQRFMAPTMSEKNADMCIPHIFVIRSTTSSPGASHQQDHQQQPGGFLASALLPVVSTVNFALQDLKLKKVYMAAERKKTAVTLIMS